MSDAREWWISPFSWKAYNNHIVDESIHVIEYSAYEEMKNNYRDAVMAALSAFCFKDEKTGEYYYDSMCMSDGEYYLPIAIENGWIDKKMVKRI